MVFDDQTDCYVPVFYVLLTSKTQQIYIQALRWIQITVARKICPVTITCDFEIALQNAISIVFTDAIVNGCLFHWKQAIQRKLIDLKFKYEIVERMMWDHTLEILTLINPSEIKWKGIPYVRSIIDGDLDHDDMVKMEKFWNYFDKFWMRSPSFIVTWNVFGHYKDKQMKLQRTNNGLERYNRDLNEKFSGKQSLLSFIKILEEEARKKVRLLEDIRTGSTVNKRKRDDEGDEMETESGPKVQSFYHSIN